MPDPHLTLLPAPALFDVTSAPAEAFDGMVERLALDHLELAENPRRTITPEGIERLARCSFAPAS